MTARPRAGTGGASTVALVAAGGAAGAASRYQLTLWFPIGSGTFPTTTLAVNVAGSFVLGVLYTWTRHRHPDDRWRQPLLGIGLMGAFTTFSTLCAETVLLVRGGDAGTAAGYVLASLVCGLGAALAGIRLAGGRAGQALPSGES